MLANPARIIKVKNQKRFRKLNDVWSDGGNHAMEL
ncbi:hypothetical protein TG4357_02126 [Thalassovita gelatinovora]|uniref:Uncharacterized protein n=1 Tax=Thalassovita gelatinovora TaxID=53501 RepID=A0A0N7LVC5_THAGE|nr:hypothetical protein TG4357_02126 [Thalassovita gelatinovora]